MTTPRFALFRCIGEKEIAVHDENEMPVTFATLREAQIESLDEIKEHIAQFEAGEREFDEITFQTDEFAEPVDVDADGTVHDMFGNSFGKRD